jgi:CubicO group peptidase (beta-lactamase class C family)
MMSISGGYKNNVYNLAKYLFSVLLISFTVIVITGRSNSDEITPDTNLKTAVTDKQLEQILAQRYVNDRTGSCVAAAYIEAKVVSRATICTDPAQHRLEGDTVAVEIGSVTKTMTAALLASLIQERRLNLDDSLAMHLPQTASVPDFEGQPILLKHLVTHTSGLPREPDVLVLSDSANLYADLTEAQFFEALANVTLDRAPGTQWAYSNFGFMLLSYVVTHVAGTDLETLMRERIFEPLKMENAYISKPPEDVKVAVGHNSYDGQPTVAQDFPVNLAGSGGVRATLNDMIRYAQAQLGYGDTICVNTLKMTHDLVVLSSDYPTEGPEMGIGWLRGSLDGETTLFHGGTTLGFASMVVIDPKKKRAIVLFTDVHLDFGIAEVVQHLLDLDEYELPPPRRVAIPDQGLLEALQGLYIVNDTIVAISYAGQTLIATFENSTEIKFGFDSHGDFYPLSFDGLVTPILDENGKQTFIWNDSENVYIAKHLSQNSNNG